MRIIDGLLLLLLYPQNASSFAFSRRATSFARISSLTSSFQDEGDQSYFQMQQIPTATTGTKLDRIVECADHGQCDVYEMTAMIEELEKLNLECEDNMSRECRLDAVTARNVLKVALASNVAVQGVVLEEDECIPNPYSDMHELNEECFIDFDSHPIPTETGSKLDRVVECAQDTGLCELGELTDLIEELERLNLECHGALSRECSLDAVEARNILKVALASQFSAEGGDHKP